MKNSKIINKFYNKIMKNKCKYVKVNKIKKIKIYLNKIVIKTKKINKLLMIIMKQIQINNFQKNIRIMNSYQVLVQKQCL